MSEAFSIIPLSSVNYVGVKQGIALKSRWFTTDKAGDVTECFSYKYIGWRREEHQPEKKDFPSLKKMKNIFRGDSGSFLKLTEQFFHC